MQRIRQTLAERWGGKGLACGHDGLRGQWADGVGGKSSILARQGLSGREGLSAFRKVYPGVEREAGGWGMAEVKAKDKAR